MGTRTLVGASVVLFCMAMPCANESDAQGDAKRPLAVRDVVMQEALRDHAVSPDGSKALWVRWRPDEKKDERVPTLMLADLASGEARPLTVGQASIGQPRFSPDGKRIAFLSDRAFPAGVKPLDKKETGDQVWILDLRGGDARLASRVPFGVARFEWADASTLFVTARERPSHRERGLRSRRDDAVVVEDRVAFRDAAKRLFRLDPATRTLARLTENEDAISYFVPSPDGRQVLALHERDPRYEAQGTGLPGCFLHTVGPDGVASRELFADRKNKPAAFVWTRDSKACYIVCPHSSVDGEDWATVLRLERFDVATGTSTPVDLAWPRGLLGTDAVAVTDDGFVAGLANGATPVVRRYVRTDDATSWQTVQSPVPSLLLHRLLMAPRTDRGIAVVGRASVPDRFLAVTLEGAVLEQSRELDRPNRGFADRRLARSEVIQWTGAGDETIEGILYYPLDYRAGERYPLVLVTHGGPHGVDRDRFTERWSNTPNLWAARGAFVLKTNYHGSSDYGLAFGESIKGKYYELELEDMLSGIAHLVEAGKVDADRLGLVGWSNGAILSTAVLTHAHRFAPRYAFRFRACAPGAGDVNWTSDYGNCRFGARFDRFYIGGSPWTDAAKYLAKSPLFEVARVETPTIIFFGSKDTAVPTEQGWQWYRALEETGRAPVRFVLFPGAGHGLKKLSHRRRKLTEELAWFDRYLFGRAPRERLLDPGARLAVAERARDFKRQTIRRGGSGDGSVAVFGESIKDTLVPETVDIRGLAIGRFEVTRAQWAAFRSETAFPAGTEDHPVSGVTADDARAYCRWLTETTGTAWRLPTASEWTRIAKLKSDDENTLDRWAGYAPNPTEAKRLAARVRALGVDRVLSRVGTHAPGLVRRRRGDPRASADYVFDVGGNVAEWIVDGERVRAAGGAAVLTDDGRNDRPRVAPEFIGFRVIRG